MDSGTKETMQSQSRNVLCDSFRTLFSFSKDQKQSFTIQLIPGSESIPLVPIPPFDFMDIDPSKDADDAVWDRTYFDETMAGSSSADRIRVQNSVTPELASEQVQIKFEAPRRHREWRECEGLPVYCCCSHRNSDAKQRGSMMYLTADFEMKSTEPNVIIPDRLEKGPVILCSDGRILTVGRFTEMVFCSCSCNPWDSIKVEPNHLVPKELNLQEFMGISPAFCSQLELKPIDIARHCYRYIYSYGNLPKFAFPGASLDGMNAKICICTEMFGTTDSNTSEADMTMDPLSLNVMTDPVVASDGFTYDRSSIEKWFGAFGSLSPNSGKTMPSLVLVPCLMTRRLVNKMHPSIFLKPWSVCTTKLTPTQIIAQTLETRKPAIEDDEESVGQNVPVYRGIRKSCCIGKWRAVIKKDNKRLHLGTFKSREEAARAYDQAARKFRGDKAILNFPDSDFIRLDQHITSSNSLNAKPSEGRGDSSHTRQDSKHSAKRKTFASSSKCNERKSEESYRGVRQYSDHWIARARLAGERHVIGRFDNALDAARAYDEFVLERDGDLAYLNFPESRYTWTVTSDTTEEAEKIKQYVGRKVRTLYSDGQWYTGAVLRWMPQSGKYLIELEEKSIRFTTSLPDPDVELVTSDGTESDG